MSHEPQHLEPSDVARISESRRRSVAREWLAKIRAQLDQAAKR